MFLWCGKGGFWSKTRRCVHQFVHPLTVGVRIPGWIQNPCCDFLGMLEDEKVEKNISFAQKIFLWLQDEQHLVESIPTSPTNLMKIIAEAIYSLLLIKILCLLNVYCQTFYSPRITPCYHPTLKVYTSSVCSSLYQMEIIKLYTGEQVGGAAGMRSEQPDNRKKSG